MTERTPAERAARRAVASAVLARQCNVPEERARLWLSVFPLPALTKYDNGQYRPTSEAYPEMVAQYLGRVERAGEGGDGTSPSATVHPTKP
jgi:hypothetical protein